MIIQCINCKKKFKVDSSLIPEEGRNIQCGSCGQLWLYKKNHETAIQELQDLKSNKRNQSFETQEKNIDFKDQNIKGSLVENELHKIKNNDIKKLTKSKFSIGFNIGKILSYIVVAIISFIALIIILDTFKSPLGNIFPSLELLLYNLFESIKDILLFLNNLFE
jgi:predicted Zn finger-like uncharacterized protein